MPFPQLKLKLGNKIALGYIIFGFLTLIAVNLIWLIPSLSEIKQNAAQLQLEIAKRGAKEIESFFEYKLDLFYKLTYFLNSQGSLQSQKSVLGRFLQKDQAFFEISMIDKQGQEKIKVSQFEVFTQSDLTNQSSQNYFQKAIQGDDYISEVFFSEKSAEPFIILATPIYSFQREVDGILVAKLNLREMWQVIAGLKIGKESRAFLVDEKGRLIADQNPSLVLKNIVLLDLVPVKKIVQEKKIVDGLAPEDRYLGQNNQWLLTAGVPLEKLPWGLIIERPEQEAYEGMTGKLTAFIFIFLLGGLSLFLVGRWVSGYLIGPLRRLGEGAKIIGSGDLNFKLDIKTGDEIEGLAKAFNEMTERLKDSHLYLERKVEERTKELKIQRDQLDEVAKKLIQRDIALNKLREEQAEALSGAKEARQKAEESRTATLNILEDIEEAKKAQEIEKNKVEAVLQSLTDSLFMIDQFGAIALINNKAQIIFGLGKEVIGKRMEEIEVPAIKKISQIIKSQKQPIEKQEIGLEDAEERILEVSTTPVLGIDKKNLGQLVILHDITREKVIEKMKSEFVTIAAHQLRTPLSAVKWTLRLILDQDLGPISKEQEETLKKGYQSNERMIGLINDLLDITRIEEGRFIYSLSKISFVELFKETLESFQTLIRMKNITIKVKLPKGDKVDMTIDKEKIKLVLQNLIENAIHYSLPQSIVTISVKCDKMNLRFMIEDHGMGIPKNQQARVFTKFFRGNNAVKMETEGTGLGLYLTKNIIEKHGGKIWFEAEENKGSTFYFTLPLKNK